MSGGDVMFAVLGLVVGFAAGVVWMYRITLRAIDEYADEQQR